MTENMIEHLEASIIIARNLESHIKHLANEVHTYQPAVHAMQALLTKVGFDKETAIEDNMKLLIDHHTDLVAENTRLNKTITDRDALMEQLKKVVLKSAD